MSKRHSPLKSSTASPPVVARVSEAASTPAAASSKRQLICGLLEREAGASLEELIAATGWLPHSTRAALTGLRKKGRQITKVKVDGATRYSFLKGID